MTSISNVRQAARIDAMQMHVLPLGDHDRYRITSNMLPMKVRGARGPLIVMLHWLSGSADTWTEVSEELAYLGFRCAALDLPGFGRAVDISTYTVEQMAASVIETIRPLRSDDTSAWLIAGHSMGGKLAAVVARLAADGADGLENLAGAILVSPSPPGVEPMSESKRKDAIEKLGSSARDATEDRERAESFVNDNVGKMPLLETIQHRTVADVLRMNRHALVAWMNGGSKEDWSDRVGILDLPAIIFTGTEEAALNPEAQKKHTLPHFSRATLVPLEGCGHLSPLERPWELVEHIADFATAHGIGASRQTGALTADFVSLIASENTSPQTRMLLNQRLHPVQGMNADVLTTDEVHILRALVRRVVPSAPFDIAARLQIQLTEPAQDGSRHNTLPADLDAWRQGLASLNSAALRSFSVPFVALASTHQDELLDQACEGKLGKGALGAMHLGGSTHSFTAKQMQDWFEDVRGELAKLYVADPRTLERIGFTGFADEHGFTQIMLDQSEPFEAPQEAAR